MPGQTIQKYHVTLTTTDPFRVGASEDPLIDVDAPIAMVGGRPVIQGSTFKGAYRSELEAILITQYADKNARMRPCIPADRGNLSRDEQRLIRHGPYRGPNCGYKNQGNRSYAICPTCYLLGTMGLVGFVRVPYLFADAMPEEGYSIRRDRAIEGAAMRSNRKYQLIPPSTRFTGTLEVLMEDTIRGWKLGEARPLESRSHQDQWLQNNNSWPAAKILAELVVKPIENLKQMGGFTSKGFGGVSVKLEAVQG